MKSQFKLSATILVCIHTLWAAPTIAAGATIYVDCGAGDAGENGSPEHPFNSIQEAIAVAAPGDTVLVLPGTCYETIDLLGKAITVCSQRGPRNTIINAQNMGAAIRTGAGEGSGTIIRGFDVTGGSESPGSNGGGGICIEASSPTIIGCVFYSNSASNGAGVAIYNGSNPRLMNCVFYDNEATAGINNVGGAIANVNACNTQLINCTLFRNRAYGGSFANRGGGIYNANASHVEIVNCILWRNADESGEGESAQIHNSDTSTVAIRHSIIQGCSAFCGDPGDANSEADPRFRHAASGNIDLRLLPDSPAIDAGDTSALPSGLFVDADGDGRVLDDSCATNTGIRAVFGCEIVDRGAYEFRLPGDANRNGAVELDDLALMLSWFGFSCP